MSENGMAKLSRRGLLNGQSTIKLKFCEHWVFGKHKKFKFMKGIHNTKGNLDYIHSNLWGPSRVPCKKGVSYILTIIDDFPKKFGVLLESKEWCASYIQGVEDYDWELDREACKTSPHW